MKCPDPKIVDCLTTGCRGVTETITFTDANGKVLKFLQCKLNCTNDRIEWLNDDPEACYRCGEDHDILECTIPEPCDA